MRRVLYISGTRADYGLMVPVLRAIQETPGMEIEITATGMHLMHEFGNTVDDIRRDGFKIYEINARYDKDDKESMAAFVGKFIEILSKKISDIKPDVILILGDRAEMLGGAIVGNYMGIPVAHVHGGDVSSTVDEHARHAITKLAHIHFPATKKSAKRILKMGEEKWRIYIVGSPAIDGILAEQFTESIEIAKKYGIDKTKPLLLAVQHPVSAEHEDAERQIRETLDALAILNIQTILIYPNADAGGRAMINVIKEYENRKFLKTFKSIPHSDYLGIMRMASAMIGNSSSGIVEAPSFHLPVVNIGTRQEGREKAGNTIDVGYDRKEILAALKKALEDEEFRKNVRMCKSPYGDGRAGERIASILSKLKIDKELLQKKITY
jgi:UDP-hydrolysing UDP-N-acetyl-D-glucosamine 2-epimerase